MDFVWDAALAHAASQFMRKRAEEARSAILKQMAKGRVWAISDDDAAAALFTYLRAAQEGLARRNLEMLAEALVNGAQEPTFAPEEFRRQASRLADLSREEVVLLACYLKEADEPGGFQYTPLRRRAMATGLFKTEADVDGDSAALQRTGWIRVRSGYGVGGFAPAPALATIARLVDFESASRDGTPDNG